jgi:hypothetical protein
MWGRLGFCRGRPRAHHLGDDDPWLLRHRFHGLSPNAERTGASFRLIDLQCLRFLRGRLRAVFLFAAVRCLLHSPCGSAWMDPVPRGAIN